MTTAGKPAIEAESTDSGPGWFYRLGPGLVLAERQPGCGAGASARVIAIQSGRAFPLGHPTTRLCLDLLTEALAERPVGSLAEVGCGSGVICLAGAALGVPQVIGLDIDRQAVRAIRQNVRNNGLASAIQVIQGSSECLRGRYDLVVANLPWEVQVVKVSELHRLATAGGRLILSGFRDNQEESLLENYQKLGWTLSRRLVKYFTHPELPPHISFNWVAWLLKSTSG